MPISDIYGLRAAFDQIAADDHLYERHRVIAEATRQTLTAAGIKLHLKSGFSNTVTVFDIPDGITADQILDGMKQRGIMLAGSFDDFAGKVIRIGHMGSNANLPDMVETMRALDLVLRDLGVKLEVPLDTFFLERVRSLENYICR